MPDPYFKRTVETSAQMRFRRYEKEIYPQIKSSSINQAFNFNGVKMISLGLYGVSHKIVIKNISTVLRQVLHLIL